MRFRALTLILVFSLIGLYSCKKTPKRIGSDLQPNNSLVTVAFNDSQDVVASTFTVPALNTKNLGYAFIGNMNDPVFGNSNFDFYTEYRLSTNSLTWGDGAVTDSVVLNLCYNGYYGDTTDKQLTLRVFEVAEPMYADTSYNSSSTLQCENTELACLTFVPRPLTSNVDTTLGRGVLQITLDNAFGDKLITHGNFESNSDFKECLKGLHFVCDKNSVAASLVSFSLTHTRSYLSIYYHNDTDTLRYDFTTTSEDVKFNHYSHDYSTSEIEFFQNDDKILYAQGTAGTRVWLKFPNLQDWADSLDGKVSINEARLVLSSAVDINDTLYSPPTKLVVAAAVMDADTTYKLLVDQLISAEYFGGYYNADDRNVWFRITEYVQNVIQNGDYATDTNGLLIYVDQGAYLPHRWAFHSPLSDSIDKRVRLEIVYSLLQ